MSGVPASSSAPPVWPLYRALVGTGMGCGLLIVGVFVATGPAIERNRAEALRRAIFEVVPGAASSTAFAVGDAGFVRAPEGAESGPLVHAAYDADGRFLGVAIEAQGTGYADVIRVLYGYAPARDAIVGIQVLESRETPGLGDRIETDPAFLANFEALDVSLGPDGSALAHPIHAVKSGEKEHPWQVDGITGATVSSVAIADRLQASAARWVPRVRTGAAAFEGER